jgi:hypothetical protein
MPDLRLEAPELDPRVEQRIIDEAAAERVRIRDESQLSHSVAWLVAQGDAALDRAHKAWLISESQKDASLAADLYRRAESVAAKMLEKAGAR